MKFPKIEVESDLEKYGVSITESDGEMKPIGQILNELFKTLKELKEINDSN